MGRGEAPKLQVRCEECGTAFRLTLKRGRLPAEEIPCPKCKTPLDVKSQWEEHKKNTSFRERPNTDNRETTLSPLHQKDSLGSDAFESAPATSTNEAKNPGKKPGVVPRAKIMNRKKIRRGSEPSSDENKRATRPVQAIPRAQAKPPAMESEEATPVIAGTGVGDPTVDTSLDDLLDFGDDVEEIEIDDLPDMEDIPTVDSPNLPPLPGVKPAAQDSSSAEQERRTAKMNQVEDGGAATQPISIAESRPRQGPAIPSLSLPKPNFKEARKQARDDANDEVDTLKVTMDDALGELDGDEAEQFARASEDFLSKVAGADPDTIQLSAEEKQRMIDASSEAEYEDETEDAADFAAPPSRPEPTEDRPKIEISLDYESAAQEVVSAEANRPVEAPAAKVYDESAEIAVFEDQEPARSGSHLLFVMLVLAAAGVIAIVIWLI